MPVAVGDIVDGLKRFAIIAKINTTANNAEKQSELSLNSDPKVRPFVLIFLVFNEINPWIFL